MMYGHYLQKSKQNLSVQCVAPAVLKRDHPSFFEELEKRWNALEGKRTLKVDRDTSEQKRKSSLLAGAGGIVPANDEADDDYEGVSTSISSSGGTPAKTNCNWGQLTKSRKLAASSRCSPGGVQVPYAFIAPALRRSNCATTVRLHGTKRSPFVALGTELQISKSSVKPSQRHVRVLTSISPARRQCAQLDSIS